MNAARVKKKQRGVLHVVAAMLALSAMLRIGVGASEALANAETTPQAPPVVEVDDEKPPVIANSALLDAINAREKRLSEREGRLADRVQALAVAEQEISQQIAKLKAAEAALAATLSKADTAAENDLALLATVYQNMPPKDAAPLFEQMPPAFAAGFLGMMAPESAANILAQLAPETAYSFSVVLAGRNANVPTE